MNGMENFQIIDAQQANLIHNYKNTTHKQLKANAAALFKKKKWFCASNMGFSLKMV
jgi:hypothetical protein